MKEYNENEALNLENVLEPENKVTEPVSGSEYGIFDTGEIKIDKAVPQFNTPDERMEYANNFKKIYNVRENTAFREALQGPKYKGKMRQYDTVKSGVGIGRSAGYSMAVLALLMEKDEKGNPKYTFEQIVDPNTFVEEKQKVFDKIVQAAVRANDEDNKYLSDTIFYGIKNASELIEKYTRQLNLDDPNYEYSETFAKITHLSLMMHDAWQELDSEYKNEQLAFAQKENPNIKTVDEAHDYVLDKYIGLMAEFGSTFEDGLNTYYKVKDKAPTANPFMLATSSFMINELKKVVRDWRENGDGISLAEHSLKNKGRSFYYELEQSFSGVFINDWVEINYELDLMEKMKEHALDGTLFKGTSYKLENNVVKLVNPPILDLDKRKIILPKPVKETKEEKRLKDVKEAKEKVDNKYKEYLRKHTGEEAISGSKEKDVEVLSRAMAAHMLGKSKAVSQYSESRIEDTAKRIRETLKLSEMSDDDLKASLKNPEAVGKIVKSKVKDLYVPKDNSKLISEMNQLSKDMMAGKDRSTEYQNLVTAVKNVGKLNLNMASDPKVIEQATSAGYEVLRAVENYTKGKKSVRFHDDGKERFNNSLDALGILYKHVPGLRPQIDMMVDRINTVRKAQDPKHKDHVDINKYGMERAQEAKMLRTQKDKKVEKAAPEIKK